MKRPYTKWEWGIDAIGKTFRQDYFSKKKKKPLGKWFSLGGLVGGEENTVEIILETIQCFFK